jgi:hypothetical protein
MKNGFRIYTQSQYDVNLMTVLHTQINYDSLAEECNASCISLNTCIYDKLVFIKWYTPFFLLWTPKVLSELPLTISENKLCFINTYP